MKGEMVFHKGIRNSILMILFLSVIVVVCYISAKGPIIAPTPESLITNNVNPSRAISSGADELEIALSKVSMPNKTLILTPVNGAWMEPNSLIDLFLESFRIGEGTRMLINHLLIVAMDDKAFKRCKEIHGHCYHLRTEGVDFTGEKSFMSEDYVKMTQTKILFLKNVVKRGYNFVFTDADILWLRNPFQRFSKGMDIQMSSDDYNHNPHDVSNHENTGLSYVTSNERTLRLYELWHAYTNIHPNTHDQNVFDRMKFSKNFTDIGLKILFLDTQYFGGFCEPKAPLEDVVTMHANCCIGLRNKIKDLRATLEDWILFKSFDPHSSFELRGRSEMNWRNRTTCQKSRNL